MSVKPKPSTVIFAKDIPKLAQFYRAIADMAIVHEDKDHTVLDQDTFQLVIHGIPDNISLKIRITEPPQVREGMPIKPCLPVSSIAHARAQAAEFGGQVGSTSREWEARGFRACDGHDPEGNVFQVRESAA